jgi:hypothetical protein
LAVTDSKNSSIIISPNQKNEHNTENKAQASDVKQANTASIRKQQLSNEYTRLLISKPRELLNNPQVQHQYRVAQTIKNTPSTRSNPERKISFSKFLERNTPLKPNKVRLSFNLYLRQ